MTSEELRDRLRSAVLRYSRTIADDQGVPRGLVDELETIAFEHATEECSKAASGAPELNTPASAVQSEPGGGGEYAPEPSPAAVTPGRARRKTS